MCLKLLFEPLRAYTVHDQLMRTALRAGIRSILGRVAIVAAQNFAAAMIGHADGALIAQGNVAAVFADDKGRKTAAILQEDCLFMSGESLGDVSFQKLGQN